MKGQTPLNKEEDFEPVKLGPEQRKEALRLTNVIVGDTDACECAMFELVHLRSREALIDKLVTALADMTRIARAASIGVTRNAPRIAKAEAALSAARGEQK